MPNTKRPPKKHDLPALTAGKLLILYRPSERKGDFRVTMNRTLHHLVKLHCVNEEITLTDYITSVVIDDLTRKGEFKFKKIRFKKPGANTPEGRAVLRKAMRGINKRYWDTERSLRILRRAKRDAEDEKWMREGEGTEELKYDR